MDEYPLGQELRDKVRLCFYEAVTNAVIHGNQKDETKRVSIATVMDGHQFCLQIQDEGNGFCPESIANPCEDINVEKQSGRGLFFIKNNSTSCQYSLENKRLEIRWEIL